MNNADLVSPWLCEAACFAANYTFSTIPYFSLDQPRNVTLVYNGDQAFRRPFIYADVNGDDGTGVAINTFTLSATVNGSPVTFLTGSTQLVFGGNLGWIRLAGQFDGSSLGTNIYPMVVTVKTNYADGAIVTKTVSTQLMVLNESGAPVAKGWTIAGVQRLYSAAAGGYLITEGDGSGVRFSALGVKAADYSRLTYDSPSATYTRTYPDGSRALFNSGGQMTSLIETNGRTSSFSYDASGRVEQIRDPYRKQPGGSATYIALSYDGNGLRTIQEPGPDGTPASGRTTSFLVDANRCLLYAQDPDGGYTNFSCDSNGRLATITNRRGGVTTFGYDAASWKLSTVTLPQIPVDAGSGSTTLANPIIHLTPWQGTYASYVGSANGTVQDAAGRTTSFLVNRFGQASDITDPTGLHTLVTMFGILPTRITYPNGWTDSVMYDTLGRVTRNHPAGGSPTDYHYNASGLVDVISGAGARVDSLFYNASKQLTLEVFAGTPRQTMTYTYDNATLRLLTAADNSGHTTTYSYDARFGNLYGTTAPGNRSSSKLFDGYGRDSVVSPPSLASRTTLYDLLNRATTVSEGTATTTLGYQQLQTDLYDSDGNHYSTTYNTLGWPIQQCDPLHCSSSRYDASGMIMSTTNRRGQIVSVTRDGTGRITSKSGANTVTSNFGYSADGRTMVGWNATERDSVFTSPGSLAARITDSLVTWIDGKRYRVFHSLRNAVQGTDSTSISTNTAVTFKTRKATYDATGLLTSIFDGFNTTTIGSTGDGLSGLVTYAVGGNRSTAYTALHEIQEVASDSAHRLTRSAVTITMTR